ncbi:malonyl-CoA synthase [Bradyrhizobium sp. SSBR45G]|uniref:malonate--CoA ligase n=1 Tax=unclassified Bradyrhizobium TaxID=2631580 RepID=UPI0023429C94|nr:MULTISPECIES: malonyl-CoA synthase [unclassified Bradyrhizobium]GLH79049.1 malonyl-CoA synthase [Bradyrhizobium sp. SSBR45G]GLH86628.1 malonyl-CoA synthase [Bradyrhizobium sp. SSBR45R]
MTWNLFDRLLASASTDPSICIEKDDGTKLSYAELAALSGRFANFLAGLGIGPDHRVACKVEKSVEALALYLATLRAGAVYLPLNTAYTPAESEYFIRDAQPTLIVCDPKEQAALRAITDKAGGRIETLDPNGKGSLADAAAACASAFATVPRGKDDLAAILYTSGTTGRSKGAMLTHGNLVSNALTLVEQWRYTSDDVLIHALPIYHIHGLFVAGNVTFAARARMIFMQKFDAEAILAAMARATVLMGVPTFYVRLLQSPKLSPAATANMRLFVAGSAPLLAETHRAWNERTGHEILERYGMTETGMITSNPFEGPRIPGSVGRPLPGVELRIADPETGALLGTDEVGMIEVKGPNVFTGYWQMPEKTASEFRPDGFFITGDLGKISPEGTVQIVGRGKDLIISGGFNVYPKEIETEIDAIPGVAESAVVGVPHADFGEGVTAAVVRTPGAAVDERAILAALSGRLAKFKQPKRVIFVDDLPRNTMGKVQKNLLRERFADLYAAKG